MSDPSERLSTCTTIWSGTWCHILAGRRIALHSYLTCVFACFFWRLFSFSLFHTKSWTSNKSKDYSFFGKRLRQSGPTFIFLMVLWLALFTFIVFFLHVVLFLFVCSLPLVSWSQKMCRQLRIMMVLTYQPCLFIHENVLAFPVSFLESMLQPLYSLEHIELDPVLFGIPAARRRRYSICRLVRRLQKLGRSAMCLITFQSFI